MSPGEKYHNSEYTVSNLTNLQINTILYEQSTDLNYMNNNDEHIQLLIIEYIV